MKRKYHKLLGFCLAVLLCLDSFGINAVAAQDFVMQNEAVDLYDQICGTADGGDGIGFPDVSDGSSDGADPITEGVTDGNVSSGDLNLNAATKLIGSGTYYGMDWTVDENGLLTIGGIYDKTKEGLSWHGYAEDITAAKVTATGVESTREWFYNLKALKTVDLTGFNSGRVTDAGSMFYGCVSLNKINFGAFKTYNITDMSYMFYQCKNLTNINLSSFDTSKVTKMRYMFADCSGLTKIDLSTFDTRKVTDMTGMFHNCSGATAILVGSFDTGNVTDMSYMFADCISLKSLNVGSFETDRVANFSSMFQNCCQLTKLNLSNFETYRAEHMSAMFSDCRMLKRLDLSSFNTTSVTSMSHMFSNCRALTEIVLGSFRTYRVTDMDGMFYRCYALEKLDLSDFNMTRVVSADAMLGWCGSLKQIDCPTDLKVNVDLPYEMRNAAGERYESLPAGRSASITLENIIFDIAYIEDQVYTGKAIKPEVVVAKGEEILTPGVDYVLSYQNNKKVASADAKNAPTVTVKGKGRYSGSISRTFSIVPQEISEETISLGNLVHAANGKVQKRRPSVTVDGRKLVYKKDFLLIYPVDSETAYKNPGKYPVTICGIGNYSGEYTAELILLDKNQIKAGELTVGKIANYTYTRGAVYKPNPKITYKGKVLKLNEDYALSYENNDRVGKATLIITGLENEEGQYVYGTITKQFTIKGTPLKKASVKYDTTATYTGYRIYPEVNLTVNDVVLREGRDYTLEYVNNLNVGKAQIILTGCGEYTGVMKKNFTIQPDAGVGDMLDIQMADEDGCVEYAKDGAEPKVVVMYKNQTLQEGTDYKLQYRNNKKVAASDSRKAPTIIVKGIGNYRFSRTVQFTILSKSFHDTDMTFTVADKVRTDADWRSKPVVKDHTGKTLTLNKDYRIIGYTIGGVAYNKNHIPKDATLGIVTVRGMGGYNGEVNIMYRITEKSIKSVSVTAKDLEYNGELVEYTPDLINFGALTLIDKTTKEELVYGQDYKIAGYKRNNKKGSATVIIKGLGDYGGTRNVTFRIVSQRIDQ